MKKPRAGVMVMPEPLRWVRARRRVRLWEAFPKEAPREALEEPVALEELVAEILTVDGALEELAGRL